jgi:small-conductance mechanosensitive channel
METVESVQEDLETVLMTADEVWRLVLAFLEDILTPGWRQNQIIIIIVLALLSWCLHKWLGNRLDDYVRAREGWPKWQLRVIVQVKRRMGLIAFALIAGMIYAVMREVTWWSRSYLIGLAATLAFSWAAISFVVRLIRNRPLRRFAQWGLWIFVTLNLVGLGDETVSFLDGIAIDIGEFHISMLNLLTAALFIAVVFTVARFISGFTASQIRQNEDISPSMQVLAVKAVQVIFYGTAFFMGINALGLDLTGLAVLSGAIGVGLGFGLQKVVSNLVSGVIILLDKSIKPGDVISLGETFGWINSLGARYVSVVTRDGREYLIPNEDLITGQVVNWSHSDEYVRLDIFFGTSYGCDPHLVRKLAVEAAEGVGRVLGPPKTPVCHIVGFGDSSVDYILRFWIRDPTAGLTNIRGNVYLALWDTFKANGISIPFPQREVRLLGEPE